MTHSVPLWNKSKSEADLTIKPPHDLGLPKAKLITVPWDPLCEEVRWALTRHGTPFVEYSYPWPLHIFATLEYSDPIPHKQQTEVPIFVNYKNEVYKRSSTDIFMYLYAHSFNTPLKIYSAPRALDLQEYFHKNLTPAVTRIYLSIILSSKKLTQKYLIGNTHLNTLRAIQATTWPIIRIAMYFWFGLSQKKIECAWADIEIVFTRVEDELANQGGKYIAAQTFTAADISFASHATFVLFPNDEDDENSENDAFGAIGCIVPSLKEIPKNVSEKVRKLRGRVAGQHAMKMWMNERGFASKPDGYRSFPSKYCKAKQDTNRIHKK
ncbi:hypothetical protein HK100_011153 [Physocladia obscura]|uniref:GST N-terminal domain-containing protein n=1 Tax=Physocladia obscura TaxID=109957 RepID=A0AAD5T1K0_9FUNG|nr:hypothetical protein HK100_011153 [Physocladia obscura]